jgi:hypothetical protein
MLRSVFQRAAVTIALMGMLLAPYGNCMQPAHKTTHSCCLHASKSDKAAQTNCCAACALQPADIVATKIHALTSLSAVQEFFPSTELPSPIEFRALAVLPPESPPTGAFILRI